MTRNGTTATTAIVMYWRRRYAAAPSCTARAISRMRSLPAGWLSSQYVRPMPYAIATPAHTSANKTGWSLKKSIASCSHKVGTDGACGKQSPAHKLAEREANEKEARGAQSERRAVPGRACALPGRLLLPQHLRLVEHAVRARASRVRVVGHGLAAVVVHHCEPRWTLDGDECVLAVRRQPMVPRDGVTRDGDDPDGEGLGVERRVLGRCAAERDDAHLAVVLQLQ